MRALILILWAGAASAENGSLFPSGDTQTSGSAFSLVSSSTGLFAPLPRRAAPAQSQIAQLLDLIAAAEAGPAGYDAVQHGARVRPAQVPTQMTLGEIYAWIDATPGQPHAIGRYQFIPSTLREVARVRGFGPDVRFSPDVQDALALVLLERAGLRAFEAGELGQRAFMGNLAQVWAGLPLPNGRSYYQGVAGNQATMSWARFEAGMEGIW